MSSAKRPALLFLLLSTSFAILPRMSRALELVSLKPFPVIGSVTIPEGNWTGVPNLLLGLADDLDNPAARFQLLASAGEQYFMQGLMEESRKAFQKLLKARKPSASEFLKNLAELRVAESYLLDGNASETLRRLEPLLNTTNPYLLDEATFLQARCYLYKKQWVDLQKTVTRLLKQNLAYKDDLALNLVLGVALLEQGEYDKALTYFERYPDEPSAIYYTAVCHIQRRSMDQALPLYQRIIQRDPYSGWVDRIRLALGETYYEANDLNMAHKYFAPVIRPGTEPSLRVLALHRQACLYFRQKDYDQSEKVLTALLKQYPSHPLRSQWTYLYASIPIFKRDWKKSIQEQRAALEEERGLAPRVHGVDTFQLRLSAQFRMLWAHLLLNDFNGTRRLADNFIKKYPQEQMTSYAYLAKGIAFYRLGEYEQALDTYQTLLNKFPQSSACGKAVYLMTLCLHSARDPFRMAPILNEVHNRMQVAETNKDVDEWTQGTLYWVADGYAQLNDLASAERIYREFVAKAPQSPLVPYALQALGAVISAQGPQRDSEAVVALQQAQLRARDLNYIDFGDRVEIELGKVYYNQRNFAKAGATWEHVVSVSTQPLTRSEAMFRSGEALARQDYYQEAIKRWKQLIKLYRSDKNNPWVSEALMRVGNTQAGLGQWAEATETFKILKQNYAGTAAGKEGAFQLIQCAFNQGNVPLAVTELLSFAKDYPDDARIPKAADNLLSAFHQKKVNISAAQQAQLLKLAPGSAGGAALLWERGAALFNQGKYELAQKLFEKIMVSYPNDEYAPMAYFYNADCYFWMKRWEDAASAYQNFFLSFPKHERVPNAMFQKAACVFQKGDFQDSVADFEAFLKKFPNHALAKEAYLNIALAHKKAFRLDEAVKAYQYFIDKYSGDPKMNTVWLQMGSLLEVQGKRAEAIRAYGKIPPNVAEHGEALYRKFLLFEQERNSAEARRTLETLRAWPSKRNEYRLAALIKLSEIYEQEEMPPAKLRPLYEDIQSSSSDPEIVRQAAQRLKELRQ